MFVFRDFKSKFSFDYFCDFVRTNPGLIIFDNRHDVFYLVQNYISSVSFPDIYNGQSVQKRLVVFTYF